jgi:hypothetical protein
MLIRSLALMTLIKNLGRHTAAGRLEMRHRQEMREREATQAREANRKRKREGSPGQGSWVGCHQEGEIPPLYSVDLEY